MDKNYVQACVISGKTDNLKMHAARNEAGNIVGWVFVHNSINVDNVECVWNFGVNRNPESHDTSISDNLT